MEGSKFKITKIDDNNYKIFNEKNEFVISNTDALASLMSENEYLNNTQKNIESKMSTLPEQKGKCFNKY